ncbi:MAG: hypothetical protein V4739_11765 [Pseudomonadota bacterium]
MSARHNWPAGLLACAALFAMYALVDDHPNEARDVADDVTLAKRRAAMERDIDALALQICTAEMGPGTRALWTVDGDLVCRPAMHTAAGSKP